MGRVRYLNIAVSCYSGYQYSEKPLAFAMAGSRHRIRRVVRQWRSPHGQTWFDVETEEGQRFLLAYDARRDVWIGEAKSDLVADGQEAMTPQQKRERRKRLLVGAIVLGLLGSLLAFAWYHVRRDVEQHALDRGYAALAKALLGDGREFEVARRAFLDAQRAALWRSQPLILLSIVERLSVTSTEGPISADEQTPAEEVERRLLRAIRRLRWQEARALAFRLRPREKQRFFFVVLGELESRTRGR